MAKMDVKGTQIRVTIINQEEYISLTDIAKHKDDKRTDYIIANWLRNRNTIEFLGIWESLNNPDFNPIEFDGFRQKAGRGLEKTRKKHIESIFRCLFILNSVRIYE